MVMMKKISAFIAAALHGVHTQKLIFRFQVWKKVELFHLNKNLKLVVFGILAWLIPFIASWPMYSPQGEPLFDIFFIKTILIVVGSVVAVFLLLVYFKSVEKYFVKEGIIVGVVWLVINWVLDIVVLVPMAGWSLSTYFAQIGLRYLVMPIMSIAIGYAIEMKTKY